MSKSEVATIEQGTALDITQQSDQQATLLAVLQKAVDEGKDVDTLERLLAMSERIQAQQAEKSFWAAFHRAREEMPIIRARGRNDTTRSNYALMADIQNKVVPVYSKHGFSMVFSTDASPIENHRRVIAQVSHLEGHSETYHTDLPLDGVGMKGNQNKTPIHAAGSSDTYGQRYLTKLVWNLTITNDPTDDDGNAVGAEEVISENEAANLDALIEEVKADLDVFLEYFGIAKVENLPKRHLPKATKMLEQKRTA